MLQLHSKDERLLAETLAAHGRSVNTQETYVFALRMFERHLRRLPTPGEAATASPDQVAAFQRHLASERGYSFSALNQVTCGLRFYYRTCLGRTDFTVERLPGVRRRKSLP